MALVVICGQPCNGKSIAAVTLAETLKESKTKQNVRIIDEVSFHLDRNQNYANMPAEKNLRGKLRSDVDRSVSGGDIVIVDSLNSIKGYRYELWCIARAAGIRYCVVYCDVDEAHCREWNEERRGREAVTYLTKTVDSKTQDVRILQPSIATQAARFSEANSLYELDRATQEIINAIVEQQSIGGAISRVTLGHELPPIEISKPVGLPELRRLRRTFVKLMGQTSLSGPPLPTDADSAKIRFVDYLNREFGGNST